MPHGEHNEESPVEEQINRGRFDEETRIHMSGLSCSPGDARITSERGMVCLARNSYYQNRILEQLRQDWEVFHKFNQLYRDCLLR